MSAVLLGIGAALVAVATLVAAVVGNGSLALAVAPALLLGALYAAWKLPIRYPLLIVTFLALTLENPADVPASGLWKSPLYGVGALLLAHMNVTYPAQRWMLFSGLDIVLVLFFLVAFARWLQSKHVDRVGRASPIRLFAIVSLLGAAWMWLWGVARGGADIGSSLWQMQRVVYLPLVAILYHLTLRGPRDREALGKTLVAAACAKACVAIYVRHTVVAPPGEATFTYATTHADSMLFAGAFCLVVALVLDRVDARRALLGAFVLPLLVAGMVANERRLVWVELGAGLVTVYVMTRWTPVKRTLARAAVIASPLALLYVVVGWSSTSGVFGPVGVIRSVVDSQADASTAWRDWENYNLFYTLRDNPLLGSGYGHGYIEHVKLPDVSQAYALYRFLPHNSILGLWAYGGFVGFFALWSVIVVGVYLAARAAAYATARGDNRAAVASTVAIVVYLVHCYGDMGLGTWTSVFMVGPALAVAGQLAVSTGAWPARAARPAPWRVSVIGPPIAAEPAVAPGAALARRPLRSRAATLMGLGPSS